jgi:predicted DNA-binding antitoxin AbrB/MazE fold protein
MATIEAIYSEGVFKPLEVVELSNNARVRITIDSAQAVLPNDHISTAADLAKSPLVGLWAKRTDIEYSQSFARELRDAKNI